MCEVTNAQIPAFVLGGEKRVRESPVVKEAGIGVPLRRGLCFVQSDIYEMAERRSLFA